MCCMRSPADGGFSQPRRTQRTQSFLNKGLLRLFITLLRFTGVQTALLINFNVRLLREALKRIYL
jgi:hypothetical protein